MEVARIYKAAEGRKPLQAVVEALGYTPRTAARRVKAAEAAGFLPPTTPGKKRSV